MDPGLGVIPEYTWVCTERIYKENTPQSYTMNLTKTDLKIIFPTPGISFNTTTPVFSWQPYPNAAYYTILLDIQASSWQRIENDTRTDTTTISPKSPLGLGKYKLRVYAWDAQKRRIAYGDVNFAVQ